MKKIFDANNNQKKAGVGILITDLKQTKVVIIDIMYTLYI